MKPKHSRNRGTAKKALKNTGEVTKNSGDEQEESCNVDPSRGFGE